jgi:hypothetical protein
MSGKLTKVCDCGVICLDLGRANGCRYALADAVAQRCDGDGRHCYIREDDGGGHWRCGTAHCGSDYLSGRLALTKEGERG